MNNIENTANRTASAFRHAAALLLDAADLLNEFASRARKHAAVSEASEAREVHAEICNDPLCPGIGTHLVGVPPVVEETIQQRLIRQSKVVK